MTEILLAIDGSSCSEAAVEAVARRPWPAGSSVRVLSVIELIMVAGPEAVTPSQAYLDAAEGLAHKDVERAASRLRQRAKSKLKVETVVSIGLPGQMILDEAEGWGADLIVVGSHDRGLMGRFLLGSVSQSVAAHAKCSVEIVRRRKFPRSFERGSIEVATARPYVLLATFFPNSHACAPLKGGRLTYDYKLFNCVISAGRRLYCSLSRRRYSSHLSVRPRCA